MPSSPRFRSRVDWWLPVVLLSAPLVTLLTPGGAARLSSGGTIAVLLVSVITLVLFGALVATTHYTFETDALIIRSGPLVSTIPYARITRVEHSRSLLAAPALSMRRLMIQAGGADVALVSPDDISGFLRELHVRAPRAQLPPSDA